ncbi:PLP-dependent aminotransferase family protein [Kineococcus rhizosphaerae]|uniref:2-aminoadipate transaminase n=1 Tax=Kineococcus rhizosphaerae TaxID=559628 RepID=A0A2T0QXW4_9ACTN|nr:PLP-dependent aminotransferase family protein [Kineococcus rhizosphaerae]PRY11060.1 2-aminoadipate transaminase [Kineococcus rhizosphaerae]
MTILRDDIASLDAGPHLLSRRAKDVLPAVGFGPRPTSTVEGTIGLHGGTPGAHTLPLAGLSRAFADELADPAAPSLRYSVPLGLPELREWIATDEGTVPHRVAVTNGALHGLALVFDALLDPQDVVLVENPTYPLVLTLLRQRRVDTRPVATGPDGIDLDDLETQLRAGLRPKLLYTIPDFQNPTGTSSPTASRRRLVELAEQYGFLVLSDDPYRKLRFDGDPAEDLDLASGQVLHVNTFSKTLGPGLRLGWIAGPEWLIGAVLDARRDSDQHTSLVVQRGVHRFLAAPGALSDALRHSRSVLRERHDALIAAVGEELGGVLEVPAADGGIFVWGRVLDPAIDLEKALEAARQNAVDFPLGRYFSPVGPHEFGDRFRWGFSDLTPEQLREAVHRVAVAFASPLARR